jgi:hypothetical protein
MRESLEFCPEPVSNHEDQLWGKIQDPILKLKQKRSGGKAPEVKHRPSKYSSTAKCKLFLNENWICIFWTTANWI